MPGKPVMNVDDVEYRDWGAGGRYQAELGSMSPQMGARKLGYNVVRLAPGKCAWPYHLHHANEEMFVVLEGEGTLRLNGEEHPLRKGDVICCPTGAEGAHQITNSSDAELKYLAISTMQSPEVAQYPDSDKVGVLCGAMPGQGQPAFRQILRNDGVDYWEGESDKEEE